MAENLATADHEESAIDGRAPARSERNPELADLRHVSLVRNRPADADEGQKRRWQSIEGSEVVAKAREPWNIRPARKKAAVTASLKTEVETKAQALIEKTLKPKYVRPPRKDEQFNYISDIDAKWYRNHFYFIATYTCPGPNALSPTFEWKFARMEPLPDGTFALYAMRHTGKEWVGVLDALSLDECMQAIRDDPWFELG